MKNSSKFLLFLLLVSLFAVSLFLTKKEKSAQTLNSSANETDISALAEPFEPTQVPPQTIEITADQGNFNPNFLELTQYQDTILRINAVDRDYSFTLTEFEIEASAPQGEITEVIVPGKAVGTFTFICGSECSGQANVKDNDPDADFE